MEYLITNAPIVVLATIICFSLIKIFCPTKEQVQKLESEQKLIIENQQTANKSLESIDNELKSLKGDIVTKGEICGFSDRINNVSEKVASNDKEIAVQMANQHRIILDDASNKFASRDSYRELKDDNIRIEHKIDSLDKKFDDKFDNFRAEIIDIFKNK